MSAAIRGVERHVPPEERIIDDPLVEHMLSPPLRLIAGPLSPIVRRVLHGGQEYGAARNRFFDDLVVEHLDSGFRQVVHICPGYETVGVRLARREVRFFEIDLPATQRRKRRCLDRAGVPRSPDLIEVPLDLEFGDLREGLLDAGFDRSSPALVIWTGGTFYVPHEGVVTTLQRLREILVEGSTVSFDYPIAGVLTGERDYPGISRMLLMLRLFGEPWRFGTTHEEVSKIAAELGYGAPRFATTTELRALLPESRRNLPLMDYAEIATLPC